MKMAIAVLKHFKIDMVDLDKFIHVTYALGAFDSGLCLKFLLQYLFYCNCIILYGTTPYHQQMLERAKRLEDIGAFGLTEFYHGSFTRGMQTKAYYDHASKSFTITTEGTKGMKYWIGGTAETVTIFVLWANLIVSGVSHGPHPFLFPLRCLKTHQVLPGITIGDCGPKNSLNITDNGFVMIDNVKIPKENLLNRLGSIDDDGVYSSIIPNDSKRFGLHLSPLSGGRGLLTFCSCAGTLKIATIALRYACAHK
jgi:acyl-CoA oxidase